MKQPPELFLLDNGSLEPAATLNLRRLASSLGLALGLPVAPVSLLHSHKIPPEEIGGAAAESFEGAVKRRLAEGRSSFAVVPLFFGPSGALIDYLPERVARLRGLAPKLEVRIGACLVDASDRADRRLASILEDCLAPALKAARQPERATVLLVDHGSPKKEVNAVREHLAQQLRERLGRRVATVQSASMERRPEPEYEFNEPLLERALEALPAGPTEAFVSQLFFSPGRHAGPGGDIETICARAKRPDLKLYFSTLVGDHPRLIEILRDRAAKILET